MDIKTKIEDLACDAATKMAAFALEQVDGQTESPIESLLLAAITMRNIQSLEDVHIRMVGADSLDDLDQYSRENPGIVHISSQKEFNMYRVDFMAITYRHGQPHWLVIECDGHDFHEKTKEQAASDKRRDRYFSKLGIGVMRFTGHEVWTNPMECVDDIVVYFRKKIRCSDYWEKESSDKIHKSYEEGWEKGYACGQNVSKKDGLK